MEKTKDAAYYREMINRMAERVEDTAVLQRVWRMLEMARANEA